MVNLRRAGLPRNLYLYVEPSPRIGTDDRFRLNAFLLREGLVYQPTEWMSARLTYDSVFNYANGRVYEQRIGSQLYFQRRIGAFETSYRTRLEQRWFQDVGGVSNRFRHQLAVEYPLRRLPGTALLAYDELFLNLNKTSNGPARGVDTNRIFAGVSQKLTRDLNLQIGYRLEYVNRTEVDDEGRHQLWINLNSLF